MFTDNTDIIEYRPRFNVVIDHITRYSVFHCTVYGNMSEYENNLLYQSRMNIFGTNCLIYIDNIFVNMTGNTDIVFSVYIDQSNYDQYNKFYNLIKKYEYPMCHATIELTKEIIPELNSQQKYRLKLIIENV